MVVVGAGVRETLAYRLVCVLQVVLAHKADVDGLRGVLATLEERSPRTQRRCLADGYVHLA